MALFAVIGLLAAACTTPAATPAPTPTTSAPVNITPSSPTPAPTSEPAQTTPSAAPSIRITSPKDVVKEGSVTVIVEVANFVIPAQGHIHYYLDVYPPTTPGQPSVTAPGTYYATTALFYTWNNVAAGNHTFYVQLVNSDHTPLNPPVVAQAAFVVTPQGLNQQEGGQ